MAKKRSRGHPRYMTGFEYGKQYGYKFLDKNWTNVKRLENLNLTRPQTGRPILYGGQKRASGPYLKSPLNI